MRSNGKIVLEREKYIRAEDIKRIMVNFDVTAKKVMQGLGIPEKDYSIYLNLLGLKE